MEGGELPQHSHAWKALVVPRCHRRCCSSGYYYHRCCSFYYRWPAWVPLMLIPIDPGPSIQCHICRHYAGAASADVLLLLLPPLLQPHMAVDVLATSSSLLMEYRWPDPPPPALAGNGQLPEWLTLRPNHASGGNDWYCGLCDRWADEGHLTGKVHRGKVTQRGDPAPPVVDGQPPRWLTLEVSESWNGRQWFCGLCSAWVTSEHLATAKHRNNVVWHVTGEQLSLATDWQQQPAQPALQQQMVAGPHLGYGASRGLPIQPPSFCSWERRSPGGP